MVLVLLCALGCDQGEKRPAPAPSSPSPALKDSPPTGELTARAWDLMSTLLTFGK